MSHRTQLFLTLGGFQSLPALNAIREEGDTVVTMAEDEILAGSTTFFGCAAKLAAIARSHGDSARLVVCAPHELALVAYDAILQLASEGTTGIVLALEFGLAGRASSIGEARLSAAYEPERFDVPVVMLGSVARSGRAYLQWASLVGVGNVHFAQDLTPVIWERIGRADSRTRPPPSLLPLERNEASPDLLVCFPGAGAGPGDFVPLMDKLHRRFDCVGFQHRGFDDKSLPFGTVPYAIDVLMNEMEPLLAGKRVHLLGHSYGGLLAFECARRLAAMHVPAASLWILDTTYPDPDAPVSPSDRSRRAVLEDLLEVYELAAEASFGIDTVTLAELPYSQQARLIFEHLVEHGLLNARSSSKTVEDVIRVFSFAVRDRYVPAGNAGCPMSIGMVRGVLETAHDFFGRCDAIGGKWSRHGGCVVWQMPGNHVTALKAPHVAAIAERLLAL